MVKVKFRGLAYGDMSGKKITPPKMVYGNLRTTESGDYALIIPFKKPGVVTETYLIYPESFAQFLGYDADNAEFYSDDRLIDSTGVEVPADELIIRYNELGEHWYNYKLKESGNDDKM